MLDRWRAVAALFRHASTGTQWGGPEDAAPFLSDHGPPGAVEAVDCDALMVAARIIYEQTYLAPWEDAGFWARCKSLRTARLLLEQVAFPHLLDGRAAHYSVAPADIGARAAEPIKILRHGE